MVIKALHVSTHMLCMPRSSVVVRHDTDVLAGRSQALGVCLTALNLYGGGDHKLIVHVTIPELPSLALFELLAAITTSLS